MRVRQGVGEPNRIYVLIPGQEDAAPVSYTHLDVYKRQEHDSLTVRGNKWFRHSQSKGGYPIDCVMEFYGKSFPEAVQMLTGENGEGQTEATTAPPTAFHLPLHNRTADRVIQYLCESRGLNKTLVEAFLLSGDIYEDEMCIRDR